MGSFATFTNLYTFFTILRSSVTQIIIVGSGSIALHETIDYMFSFSLFLSMLTSICSNAKKFNSTIVIYLLSKNTENLITPARQKHIFFYHYHSCCITTTISAAFTTLLYFGAKLTLLCTGLQLYLQFFNNANIKPFTACSLKMPV